MNIKDCHARNLNKEDAMDRGRWKKLIKIGWWSGWWVGLPRWAVNGCCCCVYVLFRIKMSACFLTTIYCVFECQKRAVCAFVIRPTHVTVHKATDRWSAIDWNVPVLIDAWMIYHWRRFIHVRYAAGETYTSAIRTRSKLILTFHILLHLNGRFSILSYRRF